MAEVERVLDEIGAGDVPQMLVYNKIDRLDETQRPRVLRDMLELRVGVRVPRVFVSALDRRGPRRAARGDRRGSRERAPALESRRRGLT